MDARSFLRRHARSLSRELDFNPNYGDGALDDVVVLPPGHRFDAVGGNGAGDAWLEWHYPGLQGPPPVVFHGDGDPEVVAGSIREFVWILLDPDRFPSEDEDRLQERLRPQALAALGPRPAPDARTHPDFGAFLDAHRAPLPPPSAPTADDLYARSLAGARARKTREGFAEAVAWSRGRHHGAVHEVIAWAEALAEIDTAVALCDAIGLRYTAFEVLARAGRRAELAARLSTLGEVLTERTPIPELSLVDPDALHAARIAEDSRPARWRDDLAAALRKGARADAALSLLLAQHPHRPVCRATAGLALAELRLRRKDVPGARQALAAARAARVPAFAARLDALEAALPAEAAKPRKRSAKEKAERPPDLPVVLHVAGERGMAPEDAAAWLVGRLAAVAGEGAEARWDGERFHVARGGRALSVDALLDEAVG